MLNTKFVYQTLIVISCLLSGSAFAAGRSCQEALKAELNTTAYTAITTSTKGKGPGIYKIDLVNQKGESILTEGSQVFSESQRVFVLDATPKDPSQKVIVVASWPLLFTLAEDEETPGKYFVGAREAIRFYNDFSDFSDVDEDFQFRLSENRQYHVYWSSTGRGGYSQLVSGVRGSFSSVKTAVAKTSELTKPVTVDNKGTIYLDGKPLNFEAP